MVFPLRMNKRGGSAASAAYTRCTGLEMSALMPTVSISSSSAPAQAISSSDWLASTGKYRHSNPASFKAPISTRSRTPSPAPKLITGTRMPNGFIMAGTSAESSCQVCRSPPYRSASWLKVDHAMAERGNQKKNFSGRSRAWMASANSSAMSVSERTTSTFIVNHYYYGRLQPHHLHTGVHKQNIAGDEIG